MIRDIIISLMVTTIISLAFAFIGQIVYDSDFMQVLVGAFVTQIAIFYLWNSYMQYRVRATLEAEETKRIEMYETQGVNSQCAYCNSMNFIPIRLGENNEYVCEDCDNTNSVYVEVTTARKTDIKNKLDLEVSTYIKDKVDKENKIRSSE